MINRIFLLSKISRHALKLNNDQLQKLQAWLEIMPITPTLEKDGIKVSQLPDKSWIAQVIEGSYKGYYEHGNNQEEALTRLKKGLMK